MLVLDRKAQQGFWIEDRIFIKVLGIGRKRVKIGIEAPIEFNVVRGELRSSEADAATQGSFRAARRR